MPYYLVRTNCEYSTKIEASSGEEALAIANQQDVATWGQAWAPMEIDED